MVIAFMIRARMPCIHLIFRNVTAARRRCEEYVPFLLASAVTRLSDEDFPAAGRSDRGVRGGAVR
jgi:hypothetical protein